MKQEIPLYKCIDSQWPSHENIKDSLFKVNDLSSAEIFLNAMFALYDHTEKEPYHKRVYIFTAAEFIKHNVEIFYDSRLTIFIKVLSEKIAEVDTFNAYNEDFKKKCLAGYLDNLKHLAKKKLIMFYMIHTEGLCYDVVEHIMTFY